MLPLVLENGLSSCIAFGTSIDTKHVQCRICPGMHLANQSLFIDIVSLLWAFDIKNPTDLNGQPIVSVEDAIAAHGIMMSV